VEVYADSGVGLGGGLGFFNIRIGSLKIVTLFCEP
jgi:hypothetical protein